MSMGKKRFLLACIFFVTDVYFSLALARVDFKKLSATAVINNKYADQFLITQYGPYYVIDVKDNDRYIVVPEKEAVPYNLPKDMIVLQQPLNNTYLVSSSVMDFVQKLDCMDMIKFSGVKESGWYVPEIEKAVTSHGIKYAGKYSAPDYELLLSEDCNFCVQNTMIYHKSDVKSKLTELGIPVFVEKSSNESHPLGRIEWILVYGCLFNKLDYARSYFQSRLDKVKFIDQSEDKKTTVAFFYITSNNLVNIRKGNDYIAKSIELAGGKYLCKGSTAGGKNSQSTVNITVEDFYEMCVDADILIYSGIVDNGVKGLDDVTAKNPLIKDFKAYKNGNVFITGLDMFQCSTGLFDFIRDLNNVFNSNYEQLIYLAPLK